MSQQIQMLLSPEDERELIAHLKRKFPHCRVVNGVYPARWDRKSLSRTASSSSWLIIDDRTTRILVDTACFTERPGPGASLWSIRSRNRSCIDWDRDLYGAIAGQRLYLNTQPDPIWLDISAASGDDVEGMYRAACAWLRANCKNCSESRRGNWISRSLEKSFRKQLARAKQNSREEMKRNPDPRDKRFWALRKKHRSPITPDEIDELLKYCDKMIAYVGDKEVAESWLQYKRQLHELRYQKPGK